jgi:hypothetical protein
MAMKQLGHTIGAVFFLLGIGATGFFLAPSTSASAAEAPVPANAADPVFIDLAPLILPVISGDNIEQIVQISITIECSDEGKAAKIRTAKPRLADAYLQDLYGAIDRHRVMDGKVLDVTRLRDELTRSSIGVLGEDSFSKILIQRIAQRVL